MFYNSIDAIDVHANNFSDVALRNPGQAECNDLRVLFCRNQLAQQVIGYLLFSRHSGTYLFDVRWQKSEFAAHVPVVCDFHLDSQAAQHLLSS
jgi:hypothetical protein